MLSPRKLTEGYVVSTWRTTQALLVILYLFVKRLRQILFSCFYTEGRRQPENINLRSVQ